MHSRRRAKPALLLLYSFSHTSWRHIFCAGQRKEDMMKERDDAMAAQGTSAHIIRPFLISLLATFFLIIFFLEMFVLPQKMWQRQNPAIAAPATEKTRYSRKDTKSRIT